MNVLIEKKDQIFTVIINRPEVENAVDRPTAEALAEAFREFERIGHANCRVPSDVYAE